MDIVNVDNVVAFRSFVVSNLYQRRWRRTLGPFGLDPGRQSLQEKALQGLFGSCALIRTRMLKIICLVTERPHRLSIDDVQHDLCVTDPHPSSHSSIVCSVVY